MATNSGRRARVSRGQSKFGCFTCKQRRVKCDETKPSCNNCARYKISCGGYPPGAYGEFADDSASASASTLHPNGREGSHAISEPSYRGSPSQSRAKMADHGSPWTLPMSPFYSNEMVETETELVNGAISLISQHPEDEFGFVRAILDTLIERHMFVGNSVQAAAAALGVAVKQADYSNGANGDSRVQPASIYSKAVSCLRQRIQIKYFAELDILFSCMLLACVELVLQRRQKAILHLRAAFNMSAGIDHGQPSVPNLDVLFRMFDIHAMTFSDGSRIHLIDPLPLEIVNNIESVNALDKYVIEIVHTNSSFIFGTSFGLCQGEQLQDLAQNHGQHMAAIQHCIRLIDILINENRSAFDRSHLLRLQNICLSTQIQLSCLYERTETAWDAYLPTYERITGQAEQIQKTRARTSFSFHESNRDKSFSFSLGIIEPLQLVAMKCRHPNIRRRAIACLRLAQREGPWTGTVVAAQAERCMQMEEGISTRHNGFSYSSPPVPLQQGYTIASLANFCPEERRITACRSHISHGNYDGIDEETENQNMVVSITTLAFLRRRRPEIAAMAKTQTSAYIEEIVNEYNFVHRTLDTEAWDFWREDFQSSEQSPMYFTEVV